MARDFNSWLSKFKASIADYSYYVDFNKIYKINKNELNYDFILSRYSWKKMFIYNKRFSDFLFIVFIL